MEQTNDQQGIIYQKPVEIRFYDCDTTGRARISTLMRYISDIAVVDYAERGYDYQWLQDQNTVFLLSRVSVRIHEMPASDEAIIVYTWEYGTKGALFLRDFDIRRPDGTLLASSATAWILVEPSTRKILRPSAFTGTLHCCPDKLPDCRPADKVKLPQGMTLAGTRRVVYSDLDSNGHMNNANYSNVAMDFLPREQQLRPMTDFMINYNHEAKLGEDIEIYTCVEQDRSFVEGICGGHSCFSCEICFG